MPRASVTESPEVHLRYTAGIWRMVKGARPRPLSQLARAAYPESGSREFWYLAGAKKRRGNRIYISVSDPGSSGAVKPSCRIHFPARPDQARQPVTGSAPPPEPGACPWPVTAGRTGLPLSVWPGVPGPGCPAPGPDRRHVPARAPCRSSPRSPAPATWWRSPAQAARRSQRQQPAPAAASWTSRTQAGSRAAPAARPARLRSRSPSSPAPCRQTAQPRARPRCTRRASGCCGPAGSSPSSPACPHRARSRT